jgi:hypothetical protein
VIAWAIERNALLPRLPGYCFRPTRADGALVDAIAGLLVLREPQRLDLAIAGRVSASEGDGADDALDGLIAGGAGGEFGVGDALIDLEAAMARVAAAGRRYVIVERHTGSVRKYAATAAKCLYPRTALGRRFPAGRLRGNGSRAPAEHRFNRLAAVKSGIYNDFDDAFSPAYTTDSCASPPI